MVPKGSVQTSTTLTTELEYALSSVQCDEIEKILLMVQVRLENCKQLSRKDPMTQTWHMHDFDLAHEVTAYGFNPYYIRNPKSNRLHNMVANNPFQLSRMLGLKVDHRRIPEDICAQVCYNPKRAF